MSPFETWLSIFGILLTAFGLIQLGRIWERETYDQRILNESRERLQRAIWDEETHVRVLDPYDRDSDI